MRNNSYVGIIVLMVFIVALFSYGSLGFDDITGQASVKIAEMQKMKVGESLAASTAKRGSAKTQFCEDDAKKAYKEKKLTKEDYYKMLERCKSERSTLAMPSPPPVESENYAATAVTCTETDGGLDYYLQGTVTVPAALPPSSSDTCYSGTGLYEFYCPTAGMQGPVARRDFDCASVGMVCQSGACVASAVPLTPETVDLSGDDLYYDMAIGDTTPVLTGSDLNLLADQTFVENMGPTPNTVDYVQELYFGPTISYSWGTTSSDRFTFTQDDRDFAVADSAIFLDNSLNPPNNFVYKYLFDFDGYVSYTPGSAAADLVGSSLTLLGDVYQIKTVIESGGLITSLTLDNGVDKYILPHGNVVTKNGNGLVNTEVSLSSSSGTLSSIAIWVGMGTDEVYLAAGDSYSDELFGKFDINFNNSLNLFTLFDTVF